MHLPNTRSYFTDVLKGKKVAPTFTERFINVMELNKEEAQFFRALVKFNQAENLSEREIYFEQLISLNRTPKKVIDKKAYSYQLLRVRQIAENRWKNLSKICGDNCVCGE
jgi:uncharacterized protein (TIGR02147 family)